SGLGAFMCAVLGVATMMPILPAMRRA
ncbi:MAG: hypothetical protein QOE61_3370, partial [Micromonosporaceae bacterium]|nr:hypothetical protein [Micromonosporaceae bacterium]